MCVCVRVCVWLTDGVDVRRQRAQRAAPVLLDGLRQVKLWNVIIRVDSDQDVGYKRLEEEKKKKRQLQVTKPASRDILCGDKVSFTFLW